MSDVKYHTLAEVKAAFESGELTADTPLRIDNDCATVYVDDGPDRQVCVYRHRGGPENLLEEALTMLGIPNEPE